MIKMKECSVESCSDHGETEKRSVTPQSVAVTDDKTTAMAGKKRKSCEDDSDDDDWTNVVGPGDCQEGTAKRIKLSTAVSSILPTANSRKRKVQRDEDDDWMYVNGPGVCRVGTLKRSRLTTGQIDEKVTSTVAAVSAETSGDSPSWRPEAWTENAVGFHTSTNGSMLWMYDNVWTVWCPIDMLVWSVMNLNINS